MKKSGYFRPRITVFLLFIMLVLLPSTAAAQVDDDVSNVVMARPSLVDEIDFAKSDFSSETHAGLSNVTGNTSSITLNGEDNTIYRYRRFENTWNAGAYYNRVFFTTGSGGTGTQTRYIYGTYRLDYYLNKGHSLFVGGGGYSDWLKGIDIAGQGFGGMRFFIVRMPKTVLSLSFGYNFTYEDLQAPNASKKLHSAMEQISFSQKFGDIVTFSEALEALEDVHDGHETRVNSAASLKVDITRHLGIIIGFKLRFDNRPAIGKKKLDTYTDFSMAVSF